MIAYKCDGCGAEITKRDRMVLTLQDSWAHANIESGSGFQREADLCPRCFAAVQDIVPVFRTIYDKEPVA